MTAIDLRTALSVVPAYARHSRAGRNPAQWPAFDSEASRVIGQNVQDSRKRQAHRQILLQFFARHRGNAYSIPNPSEFSGDLVRDGGEINCFGSVQFRRASRLARLSPMFRRRPAHRRSSRFSALRTHAAVELLEDKRLLSAASTDVRAERTVGSAEDVVAPGYSLVLEEVHVVDSEIWILSRLTAPLDANGLPPEPAPMTSEDSYWVTDSVTVFAPEFAIRQYRIGGTGDFDHPAVDRAIQRPVTDVRSFHALLEGHETELLYSHIDPELSAWREAVREKLIAEADEAYGDLYGQETEGWWLNPIDHPVPLPVDFVLRNSIAADVQELSFSATNVQVDGVDEGDIVETDGEFLYILSGQDLIVVRVEGSSGSSREVVSRTRLSQWAQAMFLHDGHLTVISSGYSTPHVQKPDVIGLPITLSGPRTTVSVFDVTNPEQPSMTQQTVVDGQFVDSRAIGSSVYVVTENHQGVPWLPRLQIVPDHVNDDGVQVFRYQTRSEFLQTIRSVVDSSSPPAIYRNGPNGTLERIGWLDDSLLDGSIAEQNRSQTNVLKFVMTETAPGPVDNINVPVSSGWATKIYASHGALYLLTNEYQQLEVDGDFPIIDQGSTRTRIHKVGIDGERMTLEASGVVNGTVDSQFSVDEFNGFLRVATTTGTLWAGNSENHLFVLQQTGDQLGIVGSVEGLAPTESIFSMRFAGDRAWMVTFRNVDPVFSFDLSDPTDPKMTGELKIPGFSDYLQLIDDDYLLAIGRGADDSGGPGGALFQEVQVSLFDVSDINNPTLLHRYSFEGGRNGQSEALIDHHAFNYIPDRKILAVPFSNPADGDWEAGLISLHIDPQAGISLLGDVDQNGSVRRSVRIDDSLYAISEQSVSVIDLDDPGSVVLTIDLTFGEVPPPSPEPGPNPEPEPGPEPGPEPAPGFHLPPQFDQVLLTEHYVARTQDVFISRFTSPSTQEERIYVGIGSRPDDWNAATSAATETANGNRLSHQFRILDVATGEELHSVESGQSVALLHDPLSEASGSAAGNYSGPDTVLVQARTRDNTLRNGSWSAWSNVSTIRLGDERPSRTSLDELSPDELVLTWTEVADRGRIESIAQLVESPPSDSMLLTANPVDHYEVWVSNADSLKALLHERNVTETQLDVSRLDAGRYAVWFRAVFADGSLGAWSARDEIAVLGDRPVLTSGQPGTADVTPSIAWTPIDDAMNFEIEVTNDAGTEVVYTATGMTGTSHEIAEHLEPGRYTVRLKAALTVGVDTAWSEPDTLVVVGRPTITPIGEIFSWEAAAVPKSFELLVKNAATGETIFHRTNLSPDVVTDVAFPGFSTSGGRTSEEFSAGRYHGWVRATYHDDSVSQWSGRATLTVYGDAVEVNPIPTFRPGQSRVVSWQPTDGATSYEVYVQKADEAGAVHRVTGITGTSHAIDTPLDPGEYKVWVKATLANGARTRWGFAHALTVSDTPVLTASGTQLSWTTDATATRIELWINEVDERGVAVRARAVHLTGAAASRYNGGNLAPGRYSAWVRAFRDSADGTMASGWSERVNFEVTALQLAAVFENDSARLLQELDTV